ncbi:oxidoreductase [Amycolatopsis sp. MJM2582]|uniref:quinone oxidoreductase family protein n=1 Tax=Amycolatopsis TaxID=1813 RepID=UPI0005007F16|nr:zinc-binding dehydrogenase [Amycolatopsis sp. MJM2582]KFZ76906.1 oxidoreductase [Amycolatopsis sp. MJM2582]
MRVVRYHEHGGPDVLRIEEADVPTPGDGQVLLRTEAIGVNFIATELRRGSEFFPSRLPAIPLGDVVGTVEAVTSGVTTVSVGDRVAAWGVKEAYADYVVADSAWLRPLPASIDAGAASALASPAQVAYNILRVGRLSPGETVMVHAAAGSIGHLAVQLAKLEGAGTVIATAGSPAKLEFARSLGADVVVDYREPTWPDAVRAAVGDRGVDVVLDSVEGTVFQPSLELLAPFGRLVYYGFAGASGETARASMVDLFGIKYVVGTSFDQWVTHRPEEAEAGLIKLIELVRTGKLRTAVHATLPLTDAAKAHQILENREQLGRVLLVP